MVAVGCQVILIFDRVKILSVLISVNLTAVSNCLVYVVLNCSMKEELKRKRGVEVVVVFLRHPSKICVERQKSANTVRNASCESVAVATELRPAHGRVRFNRVRLLVDMS